MADNYLGFKFGTENIGITGAETHAGFIINSGDDLKFSSAPEFSDGFATPNLGDHSIYTGTTVSSKTFSFRVALKENTYAEFQDVLKWLDKEATGYLIFDYNGDFGYMVKVASIGEASYVVQYDDKYNIEFDISFVTIGDWAAYELESGVLYRKPKNVNIAAESFTVTWTSDNAAMTNISKLEHYYIIEFDSDIELVVDGTTILDVITSNACKYYTQFGIVIDTTTGQFISGTIKPFSVPAGKTVADVSTTIVNDDVAIDFITIIARQII